MPPCLPTRRRAREPSRPHRRRSVGRRLPTRPVPRAGAGRRHSGAQATCVFDELPSGACAVAVVHDENGNGRLDKNSLGIPTEGYDVPNNRTFAASSPKRDESRFTVAARESAVLRVNLRY
ncbi:MAG: DUF2141 domain-containing protein [bacterium]